MNEAKIQKLTARAVKAARKQLNADLYAFQERLEAAFSSELRSALELDYGWRGADPDPVAFFNLDGWEAGISETRKGSALWRMEVEGWDACISFDFEGETDFLVKLKAYREQIRQL